MDAQHGKDKFPRAETKFIAREPTLETNDDVQPSTTNSAPAELKSIAAPEVSLPVTETNVQAASKTLFAVPEVLQAATNTVILAFHFQIHEYCENGAKKAKGSYGNGNIVASVDLSPGVETAIWHGVPHYPPFYIGPYDCKLLLTCLWHII